jgi:HD-GYP domain-containing protein (c-di-GMP phosphodiesterase class II)
LESADTILSQQFGVPFQYYDWKSLEPVIPVGRGEFPIRHPEWLINVAREGVSSGPVAVRAISNSLQALALSISAGSQPVLLAIGILASRPVAGSAENDEITQWLGADTPAEQVAYCHPDLLERLGQAALVSLRDRLQLRSRDAELKQLASQLSRNYEEITLLHQLTRGAQVSQGPVELQDLTLSLLAEVLPVRQLAYVDAKRDAFSSVGESVLQAFQCRELIDAMGLRSVKTVVVDNHVSRRDWPPPLSDVKRVVGVPVVDGKDLFGWLLALGTTDGSELGSVEASLMTAVGAILATHQTNVRLFGSIKDLFLGVVRALSSAIDAKDPYTCGHSERVARLARRLAQALGLPEDDRNRIYLSGLLHDVGKIGIRDFVLQKPGRLSPEELSHIQEHPKIGFDILSGVRQLKPVLAGVRNHHENFDGTGYPDRLRGEEIPLMARIVAVADAYDAMSSDRPYRKGIDRDTIERIFRDGAGKQWDKRVVDSLLSIWGEIQLSQSVRNVVEPNDESPQRGSAEAHLNSRPLDIGKISKFISLSLT